MTRPARRRWPVGLVVSLLAVAAPIAAHAASFDYRGGCSNTSVTRELPGGQLGGNNTTTLEVYLAIVPTDPAGVPSGATVTASCELRINGWSDGTVLGPTTGTGAAFAAGVVLYTPNETDIVELCTHVAVAAETIVRCAPVTSTLVVPQPVYDTLTVVFDLLNAVVFEPLDPVVCAVLAALAPGAGPLVIDSTGDAYLLDSIFWDCPPYGDGRGAASTEAVTFAVPWGGLCGLTSTADPTVDIASTGVQRGELDAGPLVLAGPSNPSPRSGSLTCTVQVNDASYLGHNLATASASGQGTLTLAPTRVSYVTYPDDTVYVCTQVVLDGDQSALYFDDVTNRWSRDPETATCSPARDASFSSGSMRSTGNGNAYGHRKVKPPDDDPPPPPPPPDQPFYPAGRVDISRDLLGAVTIAYTGFAPPLTSWSCAPSGTSTTCLPPPPPSGFANVCGTVGVEVLTTGPGTIGGTSACASGPVAAASAGLSTTPTSSSVQPMTAFGWTCTASPQDAITWQVGCDVGA